MPESGRNRARIYETGIHHLLIQPPDVRRHRAADQPLFVARLPAARESLISMLSRCIMRAACKTTPTNDVLEAGLRRDASSQPFLCLHNTATGPLTVSVGRAPRVAKCESALSTELHVYAIQL